MKGGIKAASNLIVVFYFNCQDIQKISTSTKINIIVSSTKQQNLSVKIVTSLQVFYNCETKTITVKNVSSSPASFLQLYRNSLHHANISSLYCKLSCSMSTKALEINQLGNFCTAFSKCFCLTSTKALKVHSLANFHTKVLKIFYLFSTIGVFPDKPNLVVQLTSKHSTKESESQRWQKMNKWLHKLRQLI
jgi:hypothetical protein